jgi:hypothetical protein
MAPPRCGDSRRQILTEDSLDLEMLMLETDKDRAALEYISSSTGTVQRLNP